MSAADPLDGRYIHRRDPERWPTGTRTMTVIVDGVEQEWVHADDFMDVQKERDDSMRCLALINAWRWSPAFVQQQFATLDQQLANAGLTMRDGRAMLSIIASVRAGT